MRGSYDDDEGFRQGVFQIISMIYAFSVYDI